MGAGQTRTQKDLREAEERDAGRGLEWFFLHGELGFQHVAPAAFSSSNLGADSSSGLMAGVLAGVRLVFITVGVRARLAYLEDTLKLWSVVPELGFHVPIGNVEPYGFVGAGYTAMAGIAPIKVRGFDARLGLGLDYYLSPHFSVGGLMTGDMVALSRPAVDGGGPVLSDSGSSTGIAFSASFLAGLHL